VSPAELVAGVMLVALIAYTLTGGADFGGGVWDLLARGPRAGAQRDLIAKVLAPIWEANHVWLIVVVVLLFVAFPLANAAIATALHIPLTLVLIGVVLRGVAFVFRSYGDGGGASQRRWGRLFAVASTISPVFLGVCLGAVASGTMTFDPTTGRVITDFVSDWAAPFPLAVGLLVLGLFSLVAAVYLTLETADLALREDFRRRGLAAAAFVGAMALLGIVTAQAGAPRVAEGLLATAWALPLHLLTGAAAAGVIAALWTRRWRLARPLVQAQAVLIVAGWGLSQHPYIVPEGLTIEAAAAHPAVLEPLLVALALGGVLVVPAFWWLYRVFRRAG
jgi:cytochrome d ubiquinol oxidase subunit II